MAKFFMYGKYSQSSIKGISTKRTKKALDVIRKCKGRVHSIYALLGKYDIVLITDFPAVGDVMKASILLNRLTGISFTSFPAINVEEFDKIAG